MRIYVNKSENRTTFEIKTGYCLDLLTLETEKLLGSTESKITKDKNGKNVRRLEITEAVLGHCILGNNSFQQSSRALYTFFPNKPFCTSLEISPTNHIFLKTFKPEFQDNRVSFTDPSSQPLEIENRINLTLVIK